MRPAVMSARALRAGPGTPAGDFGATLNTAEIGVEFAQPTADILSELIRFRTVYSSSRDRIELDQFTGFIEALEWLYPGVNTALSREFVNGHGLVFKWSGHKLDAGARPTVLMAHCDVVPVDARDNWTHPGFSGHQEDGFVWGRGALDDKGALVVIMGAIEALLGGRVCTGP